MELFNLFKKVSNLLVSTFSIALSTLVQLVSTSIADTLKKVKKASNPTKNFFLIISPYQLTS